MLVKLLNIGEQDSYAAILALQHLQKHISMK